MTGEPLSLKGKIALVSGCGTAGDGIGNGKAISVLLARRGATVFGIDIREEAARSTQALIESEGNQARVMVGDVASADFVAQAVGACLNQCGRIDIAINNVGMSEPGDPATMNEDVWERQLDLNVTSAFRVCKQVIPQMVEQGGGAIVNVSSVAGLRYVGKPQVGYSAAKAALMQMTRTTAVIYAPTRVRLNCVVPGLIDTPLVVRLADKYHGGDLQGFRDKRAAQVPMGHMGSAWDVASAAAFLASDEAKYITGTELVVDGGFIAATR